MSELPEQRRAHGPEQRPAPPGAAAERTALAWFRTAVSMGILGLLMVRAGTESQSSAAVALGGVVLALAGGLCWLPAQASAAGGGPGTRAAGPAAARRMALAGAALGAAAMAGLAVLLLT